MAPVLGYWNIRGFASPIRNLLHYNEVEFEDKRYTIGPAPEYNIAGWLAVKFTLGLDFPNVPYYIDGDIKLSQVKMQSDTLCYTNHQIDNKHFPFSESDDFAVFGKEIQYGWSN